jgi:hypothetical protein
MKKIARVITSIMFALSMGVATAADNSIYIDQSGDTSTVSVTQDGAGNVVRGIQGVGTGNTTPAKIYGDGTLVSVSQIGSGSTLNLGIVSTIAAGAGGGTSVTYSVTGNNATATINSNNAGSGVSASNTIGINQTGNSATATVNVLGTLNQLSVTTAVDQTTVSQPHKMAPITMPPSATLAAEVIQPPSINKVIKA